MRPGKESLQKTIETTRDSELVLQKELLMVTFRKDCIFINDFLYENFSDRYIG